MKFLVPILYQLVRDRPTRVRLLRLAQFFGILATIVALYSVIFHYVMALEGQAHSWITGVYWTLTVMSTLGFGDITFQSDIGRVFSSVVLLSGIILLLIVFPFTFIEFFYAPLSRALGDARAPSSLPRDLEGHVLLTALDEVAAALIEHLRGFRYTYAILLPDVAEALRLSDLGYKVMVGELDDPETYRRARADRAVLVATTGNDRMNTNVAFTVREVAAKVPIIATANSAESVDILELAGCDHVLRLAESLGKALARRVAAPDTMAHVIGEFGDVLIAEATARKDIFSGQTLGEAQPRQRMGVNIVGIWRRGRFSPPSADSLISPGTVFVMTGKQAAIDAFNAAYRDNNEPSPPVLIIGGGRVGRAAGRYLAERGLRYKIVEQLAERIHDPELYVHGDAASLTVLKAAGIRETQAVLVTTHDDDTNIYITIYCRRLRPDVQIISRARLERNAVTMHRAGADFVLSYSSMGATEIFNLLHRSSVHTVALGLNVLRVKVPESLVGQSLIEANLRQETGCTAIVIEHEGRFESILDPTRTLPADAWLVVLAPEGAEERFLERYGGEI